jgi:two-component system sensor histidine kinase GlrK
LPGPQPAITHSPLRLLQRFSFRQLLVIAFLLIAALLGTASLRALVTLEDLTLQSRDGAAQALELSRLAQSLSERSVAMERSARQSVVLDDRVLRGRFSDAASDASQIVASLVAQGLPDSTQQQWRSQLQTITGLLNGPLETALERERQLTQEFRELGPITTAIAGQVQQTIQKRNQSLEKRLDDSQRRLAQQIIGAIVLAVVMALAFGIWFTRPLKRLEQAIGELGENRLDQVITIPGPADLALVGQRLNWLRLRLVELDADKARFLRHISHELKTPLASLREGVSLLEDGVAGALNPEQREIAQILKHNTGVLQGQIEDLLRFNAAAFEARQLHRQNTDLLALVQAQVDAQHLQWRARDLLVSVTGTPVQVELDPEKIGTAIANLLSNAIRFSPRNGHIQLTLSRAPGQVQIDIVDQGVGVASADRDRIFEPFYRGERQPTDVVRGSGIGLSIVHEYVAAHGGRIALLAAPTGAHFRIEIPHVFKS